MCACVCSCSANLILQVYSPRPVRVNPTPAVPSSFYPQQTKLTTCTPPEDFILIREAVQRSTAGRWPDSDLGLMLHRATVLEDIVRILPPEVAARVNSVVASQLDQSAGIEHVLAGSPRSASGTSNGVSGAAAASGDAAPADAAADLDEAPQPGFSRELESWVTLAHMLAAEVASASASASAQPPALASASASASAQPPALASASARAFEPEPEPEPEPHPGAGGVARVAAAGCEASAREGDAPAALTLTSLLR